MNKTATYFEKSGPENTPQCVNIVQRALSDFHYRYVVVASTTGKTGQDFADALKGSPAGRFQRAELP
jgi:hypothetical protein